MSWWPDLSFPPINLWSRPMRAMDYLEEMRESLQIQQKNDTIVNAVQRKMYERSQKGLVKYGTTMERTDLSYKDWLVHAQEEAMDLAIYLERLIRDNPT